MKQELDNESIRALTAYRMQRAAETLPEIDSHGNPVCV